MRNAVGVQPPFEVITCGGAAIAVARQGKGRPVLCLHAVGQGGRDYEDFARRVSPSGCEVAVVDWPGHGASPDAPAGVGVSAASYAKLIEALIPMLWPQGAKPIIIGNSIGGAAAIRLAAVRPDLVAGLVLCNPGGLAPINFLARLYIGHMVRFFEAGARGARSFPKRFARYYKGILPSAPAAEQRARIVAAGTQMAPLLAEGWKSFRENDADIRAQVAAIECPILYAWATGDRIVSWPRSKAAAITAPHHKVKLFPGGHSAFLEAPEAFAPAFLEFASSLEGGGNQWT